VLDFSQPWLAIRSVMDDEIDTCVARDAVIVLAAWPGPDFYSHRVGLDAIADRLPANRGGRRVIHGASLPSAAVPGSKVAGPRDVGISGDCR